MKSSTGTGVFKAVIAVVLFCLFTITAYSQAQIQEAGMRAPVDIKIDGKTLEWPGNKLVAFNNTDNIWYAITNDDDNIYLAVRGPYLPAAEKIFSGGLTFTISRSVDKKERIKAKDNVAVTFPVVETTVAKNIIASVMTYTGMRSDTSGKKQEHDALVNTVNAKTSDALRELKVAGIKEIPDSLVSIYNATGVKAMGSFNRGMAFTVEMAIPLKYLGLSVNDAAKFSYNIMLNGSSFFSTAVTDQYGGNLSYRTTNASSVQGVATGDMGYMFYPTDFWAEYTFAKKP